MLLHDSRILLHDTLWPCILASVVGDVMITILFERLYHLKVELYKHRPKGCLLSFSASVQLARCFTLSFGCQSVLRSLAFIGDHSVSSQCLVFICGMITASGARGPSREAFLGPGVLAFSESLPLWASIAPLMMERWGCRRGWPARAAVACVS